jgi:hypothetical protein
LAEKDLPLPFANVFVNNTAQGIATNAEGKFSLSGTFPAEIELVASFVGYVTEVKTISFGGKSEMEVVFELSFNESYLSEIELKAKRDKSWERKLGRFEDVFLAVFDDPIISKVEILNPWVVEFERVKGSKKSNYFKASVQATNLLRFQSFAQRCFFIFVLNLIDIAQTTGEIVNLNKP